MNNDDKKCDDEKGAPLWIVTFADLMALLMVFFVLLLSFSELDLIKFKQLAGSLQAAFGVQRQLTAEEIPMGTSVIAQEFSPGTPQPTLVDEIRQQTTDELSEHLDIPDPAIQDALKKEEELRQVLAQEITDGLIEIETIDEEVVIRIRENGSFPSASAFINQDFRQLLLRISESMSGREDRLLVVGHSDDRPIQTLEFPSNWVLSAARAAAVAHTMVEQGGLDPERVEIRAHSENRPLVPNDTDEMRALNRRVEIIVLGERRWGPRAEGAEGAEPRPSD